MVKAWRNCSKRVERFMDTSWRDRRRRSIRLNQRARSRLRRSRLLNSQSGSIEGSSRCLHHEKIRWARIRDKRRKTKESTKKRGVFLDSGWDTGQRIDGLLIGHRRDDGLRGGLRLQFVICQLVNGDYLSIMRKWHLMVNHRWDKRHGISVAMNQ